MYRSAIHSVIGFAALGFFISPALVIGCASGGSGVEGGSGSSEGGGGAGGGGQGGVGGDDDLCAQDCGAVMPPPCHVAVCNDGTYSGTVGQCVVVPDVDGAACDDGEFCSIDDTCIEGVCTAGPPNDCGEVAEACEMVVCDEGSDTCSLAAADEGMACTSSDLCAVGTTCAGGICGGGTTKDCTFAPVPNDCQVAVCDPTSGICEPEAGNEGDPCEDDSDLCTVGKTCTAGQCTGGAPKDCSAQTQGCDVGVCDTASGLCTSMTAGNGQLCDDLNACTTGETCNAGTCGMGSPVVACSMAGDGCCPANCDASNDFDCDCPGVYVGGTCVFTPTPGMSSAFSTAQAACAGVGAGWGLCSPAMACNSQVHAYLGASGCDCTGGVATCSCSSPNVYVHVTGGTSPYYIRAPEIANCGVAACTNSVSETCGLALCCRP